MAEYIEREALIGILNAKADMAQGTPKTVFHSVAKMVELLPAADVEVVRHGEWVGMDSDQCSICKRYVSEIMDADSYYAIGFEPSTLVACPFCGAKMRKEDEGK